MSRKSEILEAVINKFEEEGFAADLTISDIAAKADIGKSTIYEYFKTKDDMCKEAIVLIIQRTVDGMISVDGFDDMNFEEALKGQLKSILTASVKGRMTFQILSRQLSTKLPDDVEKDIKSLIEDLAKLLEKRFASILIKGAAEGAISIEPSIKSEIVFSSFVVGSLMRYSGKYFEMPVDEYVDIIFDTIVRVSN